MATIRKRGDRWQVQFRRKGMKSVTRSFLHRKEAHTWARQIEVQTDRNEIPYDPTVLKSVTLGDLVRRYRDTVTPRKRDSRNETIVLNAFLRHPICEKSLSELTPKDFAQYRDERLRHVKPQTIRRQFNPLHNMFEVARYEWGLPIRENSIGLVKLEYTDRRRERRLRQGERAALFESASRYRNPRVLPIIQLALETAMRRGEILNMKWEHLNRLDNSLIIPDTKNGYSRRIPLTITTWDIIDSVVRIDERVFPMTASGFRQAWQRIVRRASIPDLRFHDLRHEAISLLFERGLSTPEVALISGHRDMKMLFRYAHAQRKQILAKLNRFNEPNLEAKNFE